MGKSFAAYDIQQFLDESIGNYLNEIWENVFDMADEDDRDERLRLKEKIEWLVKDCRDVIR